MGDPNAGVYRMDNHWEVAEILESTYRRTDASTYPVKIESIYTYSPTDQISRLPAFVPEIIEESLMYSLYLMTQSQEFNDFIASDLTANLEESFFSNLANDPLLFISLAQETVQIGLASSAVREYAFMPTTMINSYVSLLTNPGLVTYQAILFAWTRIRSRR